MLQNPTTTRNNILVTSLASIDSCYSLIDKLLHYYLDRQDKSSVAPVSSNVTASSTTCSKPSNPATLIHDQRTPTASTFSKIPWSVNNKYYKTSLFFTPITLEVMANSNRRELEALLGETDASAFIIPKHPVKSCDILGAVQQWEGIVGKVDVGVKVLLCDGDAILNETRLVLEEWCLDHGCELIDLGKGSALTETAEELEVFEEKVGISRLIEVLESHMWEGICLKPKRGIVDYGREREEDIIQVDEAFGGGGGGGGGGGSGSGSGDRDTKARKNSQVEIPRADEDSIYQYLFANGSHVLKKNVCPTWGLFEGTGEAKDNEGGLSETVYGNEDDDSDDPAMILGDMMDRLKILRTTAQSLSRKQRHSLAERVALCFERRFIDNDEDEDDDEDDEDDEGKGERDLEEDGVNPKELAFLNSTQCSL